MAEKVGEIDNAAGLLISLFLYLLLLIFQSLVLLHFLYKIHGRPLSIKIKCTSLCVVLVTWIGLCFEFTVLSLNIAHVFPAESMYCSVVIWFKYNIFIIFEFTLYIFWITRIYHTFKFSVFEIKTHHVKIMLSVISTICCIFLMMVSIAMQPQYKVISVSLWDGVDANGFDCVPKWNVIPIWIVYIVGQIVTLLFNLFFATLFFYKLNTLQKVNNNDIGEQGNARRTRLFQLTQKHTLLTLISVFTSIICWVWFDVFALSLSNDIDQDMLVILSFDRVVKSLCIILMYKFYEEIFSKICCLCLRATNIRCMPKKAKQLFPYFDPVQKGTIYEQANVFALLEDVYGEDVSVNESIIRELEQKQAPTQSSPKAPLHLGVAMHSAVHSMSKEHSVSRSYEKALPQMDFSVKPYKLRNFIACLTDPRNTKARYLDYSANGYTVIASHIFNTINEECESNHGVVLIKDFERNPKFSFLQKKRTLYPYQLAIRLKNHEQHLETASKLLKYAEYELNQEFQNRKGSNSKSNSFAHEPCFDRIATELASGKLQGGNPNFMVFDGSASGFATTPVPQSRETSADQSGNERTGLHIHAKHRNLSNLSVEDNYAKQLPPLTPPVKAVEPVHDI